MQPGFNSRQPDRVTNHPLNDYLQQARGAGMTNEEILEALTAAGWQAHQVMGVLFERSQPLPVAPEQLPVIVVTGVTKMFGKVVALAGVDLTVVRGSVTALLGPNGAGKTTLIRILATLMEPTSGSASVAGFDVKREQQKLRASIGLTGQFAAVDEMLTGRENLVMIGRLQHFSVAVANSHAVELLQQFELTDAADRSAGTYSGGMRRRLDLAASLVNSPQVLFLDEPTTGLDPSSRLVLWRNIKDLVARGTTVLLTTQYMEEADNLADHVLVMDHGHIIASGTADELKRQLGGDVLELHLAVHEEATRTAQLVAHLGKGEIRAHPENGTVTVPVSGGTSVIVDAIRVLDGAGIVVRDILLRRPSLDDVFLKLTGHVAEESRT